MGDLFDGVRLEDLEGSSSPVIKQEDLNIAEPKEPSKPEEQKKEKKTVDPARQAVLDELQKPNEEPEDGLSLEELAEAGETVSPESEEDNKEEDDNKEPTKTPADDDGSSPSSHDTFTSLASALTEAGVFSSLEEEEVENIKDVDGLLEAIGKQTKANELTGLNEDQKEYLEALANGIPEAEYKQRKANAAQYKQLQDEQIKEAPALQRELIRRSFIIRGFTDEDANKYADLALSSETGLEDAMKAKAALIEHEEGIIKSELKEKEEARLKKEKEDAERLKSLKEKVDESSEVIPGIKINATTKGKIYDSMTKPSKADGEEPMNEVMEKYSEDEEYKIRLHALHVVTKGFTDFSKISKSSKTDALKDLKDKLDGSGATRTGAPKPSGGGMTSEDIAKSLKDFSESRQKKNF